MQPWPGSGELLMSGQNVRQSLALLRQRWDRHSPVAPLCLAEELTDGVSISDFCVAFLLMQRSRRGSAPKVVAPEPMETEGESRESMESMQTEEDSRKPMMGTDVTTRGSPSAMPTRSVVATRAVAVTRASAAAAACAGV